MKTISKYYNHFCTKKYQLLGYARNKSTLARIRGDVLQVFTLKRFPNTPTCSVDFGIFPLCLPQPIFLDAGGYELDDFLIEQHEGSHGWTFDSESDESMQNCVESISQTIDLYLIPFFETCSDCKSSLSGLIELEKIFDHNRQKTLCCRGEADSAVPWQERSLFDSRKYYMALKSHNFSYAQQYLNNQITFCKNKLKSFDNSDSPRQPDIVRERFTVKLVQCVEQLNWIISGDYDRFDNMLNSHEGQMYQFLVTKFSNIYRN